MHAAFEVRTAPPPMPAPKKPEKDRAAVRLPMVVTHAFADRLDAFRRANPKILNRSEAIRQLVTEALDAREAKRP